MQDRLRLVSYLALTICVCAPVESGLGQGCSVSAMLRVTDKKGQSVKNITADQLKAEINGTPATISSFSAGTKPAIILDVSGSMKQHWNQMIVAAKEMAEKAGETVDTFVFREHIEASAHGRSKSENLLDQLSKEGPPKGVAATAIYDTLIEITGRVTTRNAAIVVISDGEDNASFHSSDSTASLFVRSSLPPVFGLILDYDEPHWRRERFRKFAVTTGGLAVYPASASKIPTATEELAAVVLNPFALELQLTRPIGDRAKLKLEVVGPDGNPRKDISVLHVSEIAGCDSQGSDHH